MEKAKAETVLLAAVIPNPKAKLLDQVREEKGSCPQMARMGADRQSGEARQQSGTHERMDHARSVPEFLISRLALCWRRVSGG